MGHGEKFRQLIEVQYKEHCYTSQKETVIVLSHIAREHGAILGAAALAFENEAS